MSVLIWIQSFDTLVVFPKEFFEKSQFWKKSADDNNSMKNFPACKDLNLFYCKFQISEINITEHIEGDATKFALWTGRAPISEYKIILKVRSHDHSTILEKRGGDKLDRPCPSLIH